MEFIFISYSSFVILFKLSKDKLFTNSFTRLNWDNLNDSIPEEEKGLYNQAYLILELILKG